MLAAHGAFIRQMESDRAGNAWVIAEIESGRRFFNDGRDVTEGAYAEAQRRWRDADAIVRAYA